MKRISKVLLIACFVAVNILPLVTVAQTERTNAPASDQLQGDPGGNPDVPVDGGISLLVGAGIALAAKKLHAAKRKRETPETL